MVYFVAFLEGIITFVSPCLLPMLPIYLSYFAGGDGEEHKGRGIKNAIGFILGFTIIFTTMGAFAGSIGGFLREYQTYVNVISGLVVLLFGLSFMGVLRLPSIQGFTVGFSPKNLGFFSSIVFGMVFSIGWTPCVGVFLGSALMLASQQGSTAVGIGMLLSYSMGLGIPFLASAVLMDMMKSTFTTIKKNYEKINKIAGAFLVLVGLMMMSGTLGKLLSALSV